MLLKAWPQLFRLKTKENLSLPLDAHQNMVFGKRLYYRMQKEINRIMPVFIDKGLNYMDFNRAIRKRDDIKKIVYDNLMDLKRRKIIDWIDYETIWKRHMNKKGDHADVLLVLASLEIHLKAGKELI